MRHSGLVRLAMLLTGLAAVPAVSAAGPANPVTPATPIRHLIVLLGENQTFDAVFATWRPPRGQSVRNLRSLGIVDAQGRPGPRFALAVQQRAVGQSRYSLEPPRAGAYRVLPRPRLSGITDQAYHLLGSGADPRFPADLAPGPFPVTRWVAYAAGRGRPDLASATAALATATGNPVHRFFQMWQQTGGDNERHDLFVWVPVTTGAGGDTEGVTADDPGQGGEAMGFVNMARGDAPFLRALADRYASSDNYHQSVMGGTGANFFAIATADLPVYRGARGDVPPANQIEDPDPRPGTANFYRRDGYFGGSYVDCADPGQPGVAAILAVLARKGIPSRCRPGAYYLVNNYGAGFDLDGHPQPLGPRNFTLPPQTVPTIAELLAAHGVSWKWYAGARDPGDLTEEMQRLHLSLDAARRLQYNDTGDPLVTSQAVMTQPRLRAGLAGLTTFERDVRLGTLPAVSFVVPKNLDSGHPGYSALASYEDFVRRVVLQVQANRRLWAHTAIIVTADEGGGYFDTGWIQLVDFFGDGTRVPLLVVSPYARAGHVDHEYADHTSLLKFIERNWHLPPLSSRSRDNLPDPRSGPDPYRPANQPAVGDLMPMFDFGASRR